MADDIDLSRIPKTPYRDLLPTVKSGDILFYSGEDEVSQLIRWATKSLWSHIGIIIKLEVVDRILLLESVESVGVRLIPLSVYIQGEEKSETLQDPYARLIIGRHKRLSQEKISNLINFGLDRITSPYDREEIQRIIIRIAKGEGKAERDKAYMCSELVYECFRAVNVELPYNHLGFISPQDIWANPEVEVITEIDHLHQPGLFD